jgi:hypothetical protein
MGDDCDFLALGCRNQRRTLKQESPPSLDRNRP